MKKYLATGQEVSVIKQIEEGYLYNAVFYSDEDEEEIIDEQILFTSKIYDSPPKERYHNEITVLKNQITCLNKELDDLKNVHDKKQYLLKEIKEWPFIQMLVDYLNGNFKYVLRLYNMEIQSKDKIYITPYIKILNKESDGLSMYTLYNSKHESTTDDRAIFVFKTFEEAQEYAKKKLIEELIFETEKNQYKASSNWIKTWYNNIHDSNKLNEDKEFKDFYTQKFDETVARENTIEREKLLKEIKDKEEKLKSIVK